MDLNVFEQELAVLPALPQAVKAYARSVGANLTDKARKTLLGKLQDIHLQLVPLEDKRRAIERDSWNQLEAFASTHMPILKKNIEEAERTCALQHLDTDLSM